MSVINATPLLAAAGGDYQISRSVRLRSSASAYFNRTPASAGNRQIMTFSWWMKLGNTAGAVFGAPSTTNPRMQIYYNGPSDGRFELYQSDGGGSQVCYTLTSARYRDPSAWYHFIIAIDTTQATAANRIKWYVNGVQLTAFDTAAYPAQNTNMEWNAAAIHNIGRQPNGGSYFDGYLTEINFIDGQALTPAAFGETDAVTGVWKPKKYAGTYGTNGFYLNFSDNSSNTATTIGKDYSGNGNNWTPNNISVTAGVTYDSMIDVPTLYADGGNGRGNYAVLNPLKNFGTTLSAANLQGAFTPATAAAWQVHGSMAMTSGKWYWEVFLVSAPTTNGIGIGVALDTANVTTQNFTSGAGWLYYTQNGNKYNTGAAAYGSSSTTNDVIGVALDMDAGTLTFYKNNVSQGQAFSGLSGNSLVALIGYDQSGTSSFAINFGQRPFAYTPPTGFKALNTQNLPEPTIKKGNQYFDVSTWSGTGGASRSITGLNFQPDFVWGKVRSTTYGHNLFDSVRGAGSNKELCSNQTVAEGGNISSQYGYLSSFNSDGFTVTAGTDASIPNAYWNQSGNTYVGWQWKESPSAGFDIVTYSTTGAASANIPHSLGVAPSMIIVKIRNATNTWAIWHKSFTSDEWIFFTTTAKGTASGGWNNTLPTSSVFSVGNPVSGNTWTTTLGYNYVAYLFAEVAGFSKAFSYTGNGSADGPFIFCGFKPAFIMIKRTDTTGNWTIHDNRRLGYNGSSASKELYPNLSNAEGSDSMDQLSNGFKLRDTYADVNASGGTYIGFAFAESPFRNSLAR